MNHDPMCPVATVYDAFGDRPSTPPDALRAQFERWMLNEKKCVVGSADPYPAGIEREMWEAWQAAARALAPSHPATETGTGATNVR